MASSYVGIPLSCDEKIHFTCTYTINDIQLQEGSNKVFGYLSIVVHLSVNSNNLNMFNVSFFNSTTVASGSPTITTYNANLLSVDKQNNSIGAISLASTSLTGGSGGISPPSIEIYNVLGKNGIYKNITKVIADFRQDTRVFYFIGKNDCHFIV